MTSFHLVLAVFFLLLGYGLLMVLSSSSVAAYKRNGSSFGVFKSQLFYAGIGMIGFYAAMRVKLSWLRAVATTGMIVAMVLLVVVLAMRPLNGARSWIFLSNSIGFQPSEFAKFALVIWGAHVLASRRSNLGSWKELLIPVLPVAGLMALLLMLEPDLGTTAAMMVIVFALFFFTGASWKIFITLAVAGVGALTVLALTSAYRLARVTSFLSPEADPKGSGMQLLQGLYGMADGGLFGVGLGQSRAKWSYLPHAESDFIFAIVGEELGLIGAGLLVALFITLALVGLRIARRNVDPFVKLVSATATAWLVGQAAINMFYVVGLLPVTGLPLPMISAGGTSLIVTMAIFGLLANFARREPQALAALQGSGPGPISRFFGIGVPGVGIEDSKKSEARRQKRGQTRQNKEWARTSARKAADEEKAIRAAGRRQPKGPATAGPARRDPEVRGPARRPAGPGRGEPPRRAEPNPRRAERHPADGRTGRPERDRLQPDRVQPDRVRPDRVRPAPRPPGDAAPDRGQRNVPADRGLRSWLGLPAKPAPKGRA